MLSRCFHFGVFEIFVSSLFLLVLFAFWECWYSALYNSEADSEKIYFGVLESPDNYTATYVFLLLSENEFENQIQIIKNDIRDIYTTRNGIKNKFYINNNKIETYSLKDKPYYLGNISHVNFHYWHKKLHDIIMPIAKQMSNRRFRFGGLRKSKISILYNKSLSQISNILNIETLLLIKLLKRKSPYLNITESYIMSDYEAEIYKPQIRN